MPTPPLAAVLLSQVGRDQWDRFRRRVLRRPVSRPWMRRRELDLLEELLRRLAPRRCLEWGAGYSTLWFPALLPPASTWLAVEHDGTWALEIAGSITRPGVSVVHVPAERATWSDAESDGTYADLERYVEYPSTLGPFDFILVDGRARAACWEKAHSLLAPGGVLVLHDANRARYQALAATPLTHLLLRDRRRLSGGLLVATARPSLDGLVDVPRQQRLWALYRAAGRVVHL